MKSKINIESIISYGILFSIPLSVYPITSGGITLGDILLLFVLITSVFGLKNQNNKFKIILPIYIYLFMIIIISLCHFGFGIKDFSTGILGVLRYLFYLMVSLVIPKNGFNSFKAYKLYKILSIIIAIYVVMQFLSYNIFGVILPINILGLKTFDRVYISDSINSYLAVGKFYRPSGIFVEPAHYAAFQAPILYMIFNNTFDSNKNNKCISFLIMLSLFLTGSTLGIIIILYCFIKPIFKSLKTNFFKTIILLTSIGLMFYIFLSTTYGMSIYNRTFSESSNGAINGRFGNINTLFKNNDNIFIGNGLSSNAEYYPSYPYLFLCYGIIGVVIFTIVVIVTYKMCSKNGKEMLILFLFVSLGTLTLFSTSIVLYFAFIYSYYSFNKKNNSTLMLPSKEQGAVKHGKKCIYTGC